jgi:Fe-S-cluster containining protein
MFVLRREGKMAKPDCRTCGICCVAFQDQQVFCDITPEDEERLSPDFVAKHVLHIEPMEHLAQVARGGDPPMAAIRTEWRAMKTGPLRGGEVNVCAALRGSVMSRVSCRVYRNRPSVCRTALNPGDRECHLVRRMMKEAIGRKHND